jgi:hypothetical protein
VAAILYRSVLDGFCTHVRFPAAGRRDRLAPSGRALAGALLPAVVLPDPFVMKVIMHVETSGLQWYLQHLHIGFAMDNIYQQQQLLGQRRQVASKKEVVQMAGKR